MVHLAVKKLFRRLGLCDLSCDSMLSNSSLFITVELTICHLSFGPLSPFPLSMNAHF